MERPTDVLRAEHQLILRALTMLDSAAQRAARGLDLPDLWWLDIVAWLQRFADVDHHGKEEARLFPALVKAGVPDDGGPIGVMLAEHAEGRRLVRAIATSAGPPRMTAARAFVALLRAHIEKEEGVLFEVADAVLDDDAQAALAREFDAIAAGLGAEVSLVRAGARLDAIAGALEGTAAAAAPAR